MRAATSGLTNRSTNVKAREVEKRSTRALSRPASQSSSARHSVRAVAAGSAISAGTA